MHSNHLLLLVDARTPGHVPEHGIEGRRASKGIKVAVLDHLCCDSGFTSLQHGLLQLEDVRLAEDGEDSDLEVGVLNPFLLLKLLGELVLELGSFVVWVVSGLLCNFVKPTPAKEGLESKVLNVV